MNEVIEKVLTITLSLILNIYHMDIRQRCLILSAKDRCEFRSGLKINLNPASVSIE